MIFLLNHPLKVLVVVNTKFLRQEKAYEINCMQKMRNNTYKNAVRFYRSIIFYSSLKGFHSKGFVSIINYQTFLK